jgi:hypothetical protein
VNVAEHRVSRRDWNHGEARCPECRLRLSPVLDLDEHERTHTDTRATGAVVTHRRCGARFTITFDDAVKPH